MSLFDQERQTIVSNEFVDHFDFEEVEEFVKTAPSELFISHHYAKKSKMLVQPRGGFPTYSKMFSLYEAFSKAPVDVLPLTVDSHKAQ
jgi:methylaspartate mutase epsilon subunit